MTSGQTSCMHTINHVLPHSRPSGRPYTQAQEIPSDRGPHVTLGKIQNCAMIAMQSVQLRLVERKMIEARFLHKWQHESQRAGA